MIHSFIHIVCVCFFKPLRGAVKMEMSKSCRKKVIDFMVRQGIEEMFRNKERKAEGLGRTFWGTF